jgi:hypothetical protein
MMLARRPWLVSARAEQALGGLCLILRLMQTLPTPFGNTPPAVAVCLILPGILERDGAWIALGVVAGIGSLFLAAGVVHAAAKSALIIRLNAIV